MFAALNAIQLVLYIALLALAGQGILFVLAGPRRDANFFYQLLQIVSKPFTWPVRKLTPRQVADQHVPVATFLLLLVAYAIVTLEKVQYCIGVEMAGCK